MLFIENEAAVLCVTMRERPRALTCSYNLVYTFLIYLLPLKSSVFVVHFSNAFWHRNEAFPKGSSWNEIVPLLIFFHFSYSKCKDIKICFYSCCYQNQFFSLVSHSCRSCSARVPLASHLCCSASLMSHSCHSCCTLVARVWRSCCKLD